MNTTKSFAVSTIAAAATLVAAAYTFPAHAATAGAAARTAAVAFEGTDANWFNPANWSSGRVPGASDDVVLDGDDLVVIDPADGPSQVQVRDLTVRGDATLYGVGGIVLTTRSEVLEDSGDLVFRASGEGGDDLVVAPDSDPGACSDCTMILNPNPKTKRTVVLKSSATVDMGLGGATAASLTKVGPGRLVLNAGTGYYSTMSAESMVIDGQLRLSLYYGFRPRQGQRYKLFTATRTRSGQFLGLPEGGLVGCTEDNVGFTISYAGGDGNDVVLTAHDTDPAECLLPAVQKVREAAVPAPQTREHILLARQVGVP